MVLVTSDLDFNLKSVEVDVQGRYVVKEAKCKVQFFSLKIFTRPIRRKNNATFSIIYIRPLKISSSTRRGEETLTSPPSRGISQIKRTGGAHVPFGG